MSSGQLPREPQHFPRMNDRAARRRYRRTVALAYRIARSITGETYSRGGSIRPAATARVTLAADECLLGKRDGEWRCYRSDPGHLDTARHQLFPALLNGPASLWWLSFVDDRMSRPLDQQVPGSGGFLGACIVAAHTFAEAVIRSWALGCNPGGQVRAFPTTTPPHPAWMNRLLTATHIDHIDAIEAGLDTAQTAELLGRGLWDRRPDA